MNYDAKLLPAIDLYEEFAELWIDSDTLHSLQERGVDDLGAFRNAMFMLWLQDRALSGGEERNDG